MKDISTKELLKELCRRHEAKEFKVDFPCFDDISEQHCLIFTSGDLLEIYPHRLDLQDRQTEQEHNGWKNHATWNVALWIQNDEQLHNIAMNTDSYENFVWILRATTSDRSPDGTGMFSQTPDGVSWNDETLDTDRLDELFKSNEGE
jgi:hypothetical protein